MIRHALGWIAALILLPSAALGAAGTVTQLGTANGTTTAVITTGATITAGNLVVVVVTNATLGATVVSVADSAAECAGYTALDNAATASRPTTAIYYCANAAGMASGGTITVTGHASDKLAATAFTLSGMSATPADISAKQVNGASGTTATSTSTGTRAQNYELIVGTLALTSTSSAFTPTTGFTSVGGLSSANGSAYAAYLVTCSTGTQAWAPSWTTSNAYMSNVVTFKVSAASAICASKTNAYDVMAYGTAAQISSSKTNAYDVMAYGTAAQISASKMVTYDVLQAYTTPAKLLFHSFPP